MLPLDVRLLLKTPGRIILPPTFRKPARDGKVGTDRNESGMRRGIVEPREFLAGDSEDGEIS